LRAVLRQDYRIAAFIQDYSSLKDPIDRHPELGLTGKYIPRQKGDPTSRIAKWFLPQYSFFSHVCLHLWQEHQQKRLRPM